MREVEAQKGRGVLLQGHILLTTLSLVLFTVSPATTNANPRGPSDGPNSLSPLTIKTLFSKNISLKYP